MHPRYAVPDNGIEIFSRQSNIIGKLENVSKNGLSFRYSSGDKDMTRSATIDLMATGPARFHLSGLDCRLVYDISTLNEDLSFTGDETRLCGVEFVGTETGRKLTLFLKTFLNLPDNESL
jgi:hypothetical protein